MGGKTGTTQNNSDGWFFAFTPSLTAGCWVGGDDRSIHFDRMAQGQGASMALPIVAKFFQKIYSDSTLGIDPNEKFQIPEEFASPCKTTDIYDDNMDLSAPNTTGLDPLFE